MKRIAALLALSAFFMGIILAAKAGAERPRVPGPVFRAVRAHWPTRAERIEAFNVIACETGNRFNTTAQNGQYLGLFQMGAYARSRYGHGETAMAQARAAYRYYVDSGRDWSPWGCSP